MERIAHSWTLLSSLHSLIIQLSIKFTSLRFPLFFPSVSSSDIITCTSNSVQTFFQLMLKCFARDFLHEVCSRHLGSPIPCVTFVIVSVFLIEPNSARSDDRGTRHFRFLSSPDDSSECGSLEYTILHYCHFYHGLLVIMDDITTCYEIFKLSYSDSDLVDRSSFRISAKIAS